MPEPLEEQLNDLAANATNVISPIFRMFGWNWIRNGEAILPSHLQIQREIERLFENMVEHNFDWTGCGRITVRKDQDDGVDIYSVSLDIGEICISTAEAQETPETPWMLEGF